MSKANHIPYGWDEIESQIRRAIVAQASILSVFGPNADGAALFTLYLGIDVDVQDPHDLTKEEIASIPIERHNLFNLVRRAYLYAYQLDGAEQASTDDHYEIACGLLNGFPQTDIHGDPSPLDKLNEHPLRRALETFDARWNLNALGNGLSVRQLSLLANMTIPAVRTSLSKEGFRMEQVRIGGEVRRDDDANFNLSAGDALLWLSRRRGFIPNRNALAPHERETVVAEIIADTDLDFPAALNRILEFTNVTQADLVLATGREGIWVSGLLLGNAVDADLLALKAVARAISAPEPLFASRAVRCILEAEALQEKRGARHS